MTPGTLEQISLFQLIVQDSEEAAAGEVVGVWWHHLGCRAQSQIVISEAARAGAGCWDVTNFGNCMKCVYKLNFSSDTVIMKWTFRAIMGSYQIFTEMWQLKWRVTKVDQKN